MKSVQIAVMSCLVLGMHAQQAAAKRQVAELPLGSFAGGAFSQLNSTITGAMSGATVPDQINDDDGLFDEDTCLGLGQTYSHVLLYSGRYQLSAENTARVDGLSPDAYQFDRGGGYTYSRFHTGLNVRTNTAASGGAVRFAFRLKGAATVSGDANANASIAFNDSSIWSHAFSSGTAHTIDDYLITQPVPFTNGIQIPFNAAAWIDTSVATVIGSALTSSADVHLQFLLAGWIGDGQWTVSDGVTQIARVPEPSAAYVVFALWPTLAARRLRGRVARRIRQR